MDLSGRPLLDTRTDQALFADREKEVERLLKDTRAGLNLLVVGEGGSGKTTLLRKLVYVTRELSPEMAPPAFVEGRLVSDASTFLDLVRLRLGLRPTLMEPTALQATMVSMRGKRVLDDTLELPRLISSLQEAVVEGRRLVVVDELPSAVGRTVFGRLRDEVWQLPLTWVVSTTEDESGPYLSPPADAFFDTVLRLDPLSKIAQRKVLQARAGNKGVQVAKEIDEGNPRRLLAVAREVLQGNAPRPDVLRAASERDARVAVLGRSASMLMAELESLGAASASDERLLSRLGWTRTRAVQVFRQLEEAKLVTSSTVKGESGRPRKVFRPADLLGSIGT